MTKHAALPGRLLMLGFGSIGQGVLPLILRHIDITPDRITIISPDDAGKAVAEEYGVTFLKMALTRENYAAELEQRLGQGDFLCNVSVEVSSVALIRKCRELGALYVDTCVEPWPGGYTDPDLSPSQRSNYALRESALDVKRELGAGPTAVIAHGANPGLVSHFLKAALLDIAKASGMDATRPESREGWAALARDLGVKVVHIAERDTQKGLPPKERGEFVNTWSVNGFVGEGCQPSELGWGTHEPELPPEGRRHDFGCDAAIYLMRPGAGTRVRTWVPSEGPIHGWLITHNESISTADYYTLRDEAGEVVYRPTCHYAYHPCDEAVLSLHEFAGKNWELQPRVRILMDETQPGGVDELGVLVNGPAKGSYWYGSQLTIDEARELVPHNNATSLQVTVSVLAAMIWAIENPNAGVVEPEDIDERRILEISTPYLGTMAGYWTNWTPLQDRETLFPEDLDRNEPWAFKNVIVR
ncbi:MAG: homospermidine synthase [Tistrella sp.]|jgi:homospermidine synthase|uniref:Homospermidine synthase n=1 Tax=Tistrella mobilis TaxID=171437 RepID=A0A162LC06_9PROT|nr:MULTISPECIES: saccharopine dehydrogenase C-terminal domain-containing protein [Tistrella]KYO54335.1 homospermidine synthase [Tistrella mobilis]MAD38439.1 homospermidine synthase [Tistrella sp.]MBA77444.1 homospermidine synthase [Tistrella sp.]